MNLGQFDKFKKYYDNGDPSHDWLHIQRVVDTCVKLAQELKANQRTLLPAAFLHDLVNIPKDSIHRPEASRLAAEKAKRLLCEDHIQADYTEAELNQIAQIILEHSYSANIKASSLESQILQDADKLDAMGAIGIMRWSTCGARMNANYYHAEDPWAEKRELDDRKYSLDHFEKKLIKLYGRLNTEPAKSIGQARLIFFQQFLAQLKSEIPD